MKFNKHRKLRFEWNELKTHSKIMFLYTWKTFVSIIKVILEYLKALNKKLLTEEDKENKKIFGLEKY